MYLDVKVRLSNKFGAHYLVDNRRNVVEVQQHTTFPGGSSAYDQLVGVRTILGPKRSFFESNSGRLAV